MAESGMTEAEFISRMQQLDDDEQINQLDIYQGRIARLRHCRKEEQAMEALREQDMWLKSVTAWPG